MPNRILKEADMMEGQRSLKEHASHSKILLKKI